MHCRVFGKEEQLKTDRNIFNPNLSQIHEYKSYAYKKYGMTTYDE